MFGDNFTDLTLQKIPNSHSKANEYHPRAHL